MSESGYIDWPVHLTDSGEGGMWVYAMVLADDAHDFVHCCGPAATIALPLPDVVVSDPARIYPPMRNEWWRDPDPVGLDTPEGRRAYTTLLENRLFDRMSNGSSVLAAVCLGTSSGSWTDEHDHWRCTAVDLTDAGRALVRSLESLYDAPVALVTYLDT